MIRHLLHVDFDHQRGLQEQVRESLVKAILGVSATGATASGFAQHHRAGV